MPTTLVIPEDITVWVPKLHSDGTPYLDENGWPIYEVDWVATWDSIANDPVEIIARALLMEEGNKIGGAYEDDVFGVAWAIMNRYDSEGTTWSGNWRTAATSMIHGMSIPMARDPMTYWGSRFNNRDDMLAAYNRAREIAQEVLNANPSEDITGGAVRWADSDCPGGVCNYDDRGRVTNGIPYQRTHFDTDFEGHGWCVSTVPAGSCE